MSKRLVVHVPEKLGRFNFDMEVGVKPTEFMKGIVGGYWMQTEGGETVYVPFHQIEFVSFKEVESDKETVDTYDVDFRANGI